MARKAKAIAGRTLKMIVGTNIGTCLEKAALPLDVVNTWKLFTRVQIPVADAATIPLSIAYTVNRPTRRECRSCPWRRPSHCPSGFLSDTPRP
jgi:hypothetical protein